MNLPDQNPQMPLGTLPGSLVVDGAGPPEKPAGADNIEPKKMVRPDFYRVCKWIEAPDRIREFITKAELARRATADLGVHVATSAIDDALEATGVRIPPPPMENPEQAIPVLASALIDLLRHIGKEPSSALLQLA